ncbi:MAG: hypothetical protein U1E29_05255 [Coriobacteriia bacterium]|nr:hypothetical protein [Coriobacteriia bacterium]
MPDRIHRRTPVSRITHGLLGRWRALGGRRQAIVTSAVTVVLAAIILWIGMAVSSPERTEPPVQGLTALQESDLEYRKALDALASGETTTAIALLERALQLDSANERARRQLTRTRSGAGDSGNGGTPDVPADSAPDPVAPDDPAFNQPIAELADLLPPYVDGYVLGVVVKGEDDVTVSGTPVDLDLSNTRSLWTVHDTKTTAGATAFIADVTGSLYTQDAATLTIGGAQAFFGTDGTRFASIVYVRGRYVFEVVLTSATGDPAGLRRETEDAARAFPDTVR